MDSLGSVVNSLHSGEVIAYPTEGVWGLGCDPFNEEAISILLKVSKSVKSEISIHLLKSIIYLISLEVNA